jgi:DNA-directed RNA polymerase specialized sigma24 family protein
VTETLDLDVHLAAIAAGDATAFGRWLAGAEPVVRRSLRSFAARVDVEAVVQETLLRAWQVAPRVEPDGRPNGLLRLALRAGRNLAIDESRRAGAREVQLQGGEGETSVSSLEEGSPSLPDPLLRRVIAICWEKLPPQPQIALRARLDAAGAEPDATSAARCGMRLNTFLQNVARARKHLLACLDSQGVPIDVGLSPGGAP